MLGAGIPGVGVGETGIGPPHNTMKLQELAEETRLAVIGLLGIGTKVWAGIILDVPQTVGQRATAGASNFLLLRRPFGELDLVGEQNTASHDVNETELGFDHTQALFGNSALGLLPDNFDTEVIVGISRETLKSIGGDFVLPFLLGDRGTNVVRVKTTVSVLVVQAQNSTVLDVLWLGQVVPSISAVDGFAVNSEGLCLVLEKPNIVLVLVGVEGDLLLLAAGRVHQGVRVKVASLSVDVANGDLAAENHIGRDILHLLGVERSLELGAHEAIALAGVDETHEVNGKHGHVDCQGNDDQRESASHEMLEPQAQRNVLVIAEQDP